MSLGFEKEENRSAVMCTLGDLVNKPEVLKDKPRQEVVSPPHLPISHTLGHCRMWIWVPSLWSQLLICPSGTSHWKPSEILPGRSIWWGGGNKGGIGQELLTQGWHPEIQEICEAWTGGHKEGAQTKTPSLPPLVWGHRAQSLGTRAPFLLATLKTQQDRKNRNRMLWLTQFPGRQELPRRLCTQVSALPSLFLERTHYATRRYRPENQLLPLTLVCLELF